MQINVQASVPYDLPERLQRQIPFAIMTALNNTAFDARAHVQAELPGVFRLKNSWTVRHILVEKATKQNWHASVTAPDYLAKQQDGGTVTPMGRHMAAPEKMRGKIVRRAQRPGAVLDKPNVFILQRRGHTSIVQRVGRRRLVVLFWLTGEQHYASRFGMDTMVDSIVRTRFDRHFDAAMQRAISTAR